MPWYSLQKCAGRKFDEAKLNSIKNVEGGSKHHSKGNKIIWQLNLKKWGSINICLDELAVKLEGKNKSV